MKTEEIAKLVLDGAEITYDRNSQCWYIANQPVRKQTLHIWEQNDYISRDFPLFEAGNKEYYKLTEQGRESLTLIYLLEQQSNRQTPS